MVQDWRYNYLYLQHETTIMQISLKNHSHHDVTHMTMEEFDSTLSKILDSSKEEAHENLWMCGASRARMAAHSSKWCKDTMNDTNVLVPYPKEELESMEQAW